MVAEAGDPRLQARNEGESIEVCGNFSHESAAEELRRQGKEHRTLKLYGQERNLTTSAIARMNLFLHGIEDFDVVRDDTLSNPAFLDGDKLRQFDVVLANPPYSIKAWDRAAWQSDKWGRNRYGTPPQGRADYAFWQHILSSMKPETGRCAILFPHGVLFRDEEKDMRSRMVQDDVVEAVLGLGNLLSYHPTRAAFPPSSQDGMIVTVKLGLDASGKAVVDQPVVYPTWVDKDNGIVIRPVLADLADPNVSAAKKAQLQVSLDRTTSVLGDFIAK